jgi:hypothetical protein
MKENKILGRVENKLVHIITIGHNIDLALIVYGSSITETTLRMRSISCVTENGIGPTPDTHCRVTFT